MKRWKFPRITSIRNCRLFLKKISYSNFWNKTYHRITFIYPGIVGGRIQVNYRFSLLGGILFIPVRLRFKRYFSNEFPRMFVRFYEKTPF